MIIKHGETMERLETKLDALKELFEAHIARQDEQFEAMEKYWDLKFSIDTCDKCSAAPKIKSLEDNFRAVETRQNYFMGALILIGVIVPYILPKLIG